MMSILPDQYTRRARLYPFFISTLPLCLTTLALVPNGIPKWNLLWSLIVWCGGTMLIAQLVRDAGKKKEPLLYNLWGGKPTTRKLRHREAENRTMVDLWHKRLRALIPEIHIPTFEEELADPTTADDSYDVCVSILRERTRDKSRFPLVFGLITDPCG